MSDFNLYFTFFLTQDPIGVKFSKRYSSYSFRFQLNVNVFYVLPVTVLTKLLMQLLKFHIFSYWKRLTVNIVANGEIKDGKLILEMAAAPDRVAARSPKLGKMWDSGVPVGQSWVPLGSSSGLFPVDFFSARGFSKRHSLYSFDSFKHIRFYMFPITVLMTNVTYRNFEISNFF